MIHAKRAGHKLEIRKGPGGPGYYLDDRYLHATEIQIADGAVAPMTATITLIVRDIVTTEEQHAPAPFDNG